jgi:hypothetical protein
LVDGIAAAVLLAIFSGFIPGSWTGTAAHYLAAGVFRPLTAPTKHMTLVSQRFWSATDLPRRGTLLPANTAAAAAPANGSLTFKAAQLSLALPAAALRHSVPVPVATYHCTAALPERQVTFIVGGQTLTLTAYQGGCAWYFLTAGPRRPLPADAYRQAMGEERLYRIPKALATFLAHEH